MRASWRGVYLQGKKLAKIMREKTGILKTQQTHDTINVLRVFAGDSNRYPSYTMRINLMKHINSHSIVDK